MTSTTPVVYHSEWCRSLRPIWLLIELGVDFDIRAFKWDDLKSAEFLAVSPAGTVPILEDGPIKMKESGAITEFLAQKYGDGRATVMGGTPEHAAYCQWFHVAEATFMVGGAAALFHWYDASSSKDPGEKKKILKCISDVLQELEAFLGSKSPAEGYLITLHPTAADFMMGYPLIMLKDLFAKDVDLSAFPAVDKYISKLQALPSAKATFGKFNSLPNGLHHVDAKSLISPA